MLPTLTVGDAIGNQTLEIRRLLRAQGHTSDIFAERWHPALDGQCRHFEDYRKVSDKDNLLILHYSIGGPCNALAFGAPDKLVMYYHNITPPHFFYATNGEMARQLQQARAELRQWAARAPALAASEFNREELLGMGFEVIGIAPYITVFEALTAQQEAAGRAKVLAKIGAPGKRKWLSVGRLAPNKRIEDVIRAFYFYHAWIEPDSQLLLLGGGDGNEAYVDGLFRLVSRLNLDGSVIFLGHGNTEMVAACMRQADVYVCMSEHEGFCIPLIEAMRFDLPVLAFASTGVPYTLGDAGILIKQKNFQAIAEMADELMTNAPLRERVIARQRQRLNAFNPDAARLETLRQINNAVDYVKNV